MERESFEDREVAQLLNRYFVSVKVDREERPDIDHIYMNVCQALTGSGGWPLTVILTPEKKPFYAGTYFPRDSRYGRPGMLELLPTIGMAWQTKRQELLDSAEKITHAVLDLDRTDRQEDLFPGIVDELYRDLRDRFDSTHGGFGDAPKFPAPHNLLFLLRYYHLHREPQALAMAEKTLEEMFKGGIFDHVGFGFARYSTDRRWLAPHFEKMLYDNALLSRAYLEAFQVTGHSFYRDVAQKVFDYIFREMTAPEGPFYSAQDADSEGVEGKYYLWDPEEVKTVLGPEEGQSFCETYDITPQGNFEGKNIPNLLQKGIKVLEGAEADSLEKARKQLLRFREKRVPPYKDDKILSSWNALLIASLALAARVLDREDYRLAAQKALDFLLHKMRREDGRLLARYRDKEAALPAYLDDYAFLIWALLEMYDTTREPRWLKEAVTLNHTMIRDFQDREQGGFFMTGAGGEELLTRPKEFYDGAIPAGNSVAAFNLIRLYDLTGDPAFEKIAREVFRACSGQVRQAPAGYSFLLLAYQYLLSPRRQIIIAAGEEAGEGEWVRSLAAKAFNPYDTVIYKGKGAENLEKIIPYLKEYKPVKGQTTVYICRDMACGRPLTDRQEIQQALGLSLP